MAAEARLPAVVVGDDEPADNDDRLTLARIAYDSKRFATAARLWAEALEFDPKLAEDRKELYRYAWPPPPPWPPLVRATTYRSSTTRPGRNGVAGPSAG